MEWWECHQHLAKMYPHLAKMALKYSRVVATSVPSERLFSTAGNIVTAKRAALDPGNVEKLIFLHDNLPRVALPCKRAKLN